MELKEAPTRSTKRPFNWPLRLQLCIDQLTIAMQYTDVILIDEWLQAGFEAEENCNRLIEHNLLETQGDRELLKQKISQFKTLIKND